jgi:hypothetical protein
MSGAVTAPVPQSSNELASLLGISNDQLGQLQKAFAAAGSSFAGPQASSAGYMRSGPAPQMNQGAPNNLLTTILQMRANQAAAMGQPFQTGVQAPRVSLLR